MRYVSLATAVALSILAPAASFAQTGLSITNYQFVGSQTINATSQYRTYRADLVNTGGALGAVTAVGSSSTGNVQIAAGQGNLHFSPVPAGSTVHSINSFTLLVDTTVPFDISSVQWSFSGPAANAGPAQTGKVGTTITLDGSNSTNPSGVGTLSYSWAITNRPPGSTATLTNPTSVNPSFVLDVKGSYTIAMSVSNGAGSDTATVNVTTINSAPVANPGPNQTVSTGGTAFLDASGSTDVDGNNLNYKWSMVSVPTGSTAALNAPNYVKPHFNIDLAGAYVVQLIVNDGQLDSAPATVTVSTSNTPPVAKAGTNQSVAVGSLVQLNGSGSTDVNGDALTYHWTLNTVPGGSAAVLSNPLVVNPTFTADQPGTYVAQLIVNDGKANSTPSTVTITTTGIQGPTANAGPNQTVAHSTTVTLAGTGTDPQSLPLTYQWSLTVKPAGSAAVLSGATTQNPTFVADVPGNYVAQLVVNNGTISSSPATVSITTTNTAPVAKPGANQTVNVNDVVLLDGGGSSDADSDPLTYSWSFTNKPAASSATLSGSSSKTPSFTADAAGSYIVQLIVNDGFTNSTPVTATITAGGAAITLTPNPLNLTNVASSLSVLLSTPAGASGQVVSLSSSNAAIASVPPSVLVPANSTGANVSVTPGNSGNATITGSASGFTSGSSTVSVTAPPSGIVLPSSPVTTGPGHASPFAVTLANAPANSVIVSLVAGDTSIATISPANIVFQAGSKTPTATPQVTGVGFGSTSITASSIGLPTVSQQVVVATTLTISPSTLSIPIQNGQILTLTLSSPAPGNGVVLNLTSDSPTIVSVPSTVTIPGGSTTAAVRVTGVGAGTTTIHASSLPTVADATASVTVVAPGAIILTPNLVVNPNKFVTFPVTLTVPAPAGGLTVTLTQSENFPVLVDVAPKSIFIPAGATQPVTQPTIEGVNFGISYLSAFATGYTEAHVSAICTEGSQITMPSLLNIGVGKSVTVPVSLRDAAPPGGVNVTLVVSDPSRATVSPTSIFIPGGAVVPAVQPQITGLQVGTTNMNAIAPGYAGAVVSIVVSSSALNFSPGTLTITGTGTQNLNLTSSTPAPSGGLTVTLTSLTPSVATVGSQVVIPPNATSIPVPVTAVANGTAVIRASAVNLPDATATVTVTGVGGGGGIALGNVSLNLGQTAALSVTLPSAAPPSGVTVALASSDTSKVSLSAASVFIASGNVTPAVQPQVTGLNLGSANITATATGYTQAVQSVSVSATLSFAPNTLNVAGAGPATLNLNLSGPAPAGGLVVGLSSSNTSVATVGSSATFQAGATSTTVPFTVVGPGSAVIHASNANLADTAATITFSTTSAILVPANTNVGAGQTVPFPVTLSAPSAGGMNISLVSSDSSKVTVSPSVVFIAGGSLAPASTPTVTGAGLGSATITASSSFAGVTPVTGSVQVKTGLSFSPTTLTVSGTQNIVLVLSQPSPAGGLVVNLSSDNPSIATVSSTVNIPQNVSAIQVPVTAIAGAGGSTIIRASGANFTSAAATINVAAGLAVTTSSLPNGQVGVPYSQALAASGGNTPYTWSITSGALPAGMNLTSGIIGGTPTAVATNAAITVKVTDSSSPAKTNTANLTITVLPAVTVSLAAGGGTGQIAAVNAQFANPLIVTAKDSNNNPVSGLTITFQSSGAGAGIVTKTAQTNASGIASALVTANATPGAYTVTASTPNASSVTFSLTNTGAPTISVVSGNNQTVLINQPFASPLSVVVKDATNNPVSGATVTFTPPANGAGGSFAGGNTAITNGAGVATSTQFTANGTSGSYNVTASTPSVATPATFALTNNLPSAGPTITVVSGTPQSIKFGTKFANQLVVLVKDGNGNPVQGVGVAFSGPNAGASLSGTVIAPTNASGVASAFVTANNVVGSYTVNATLAGVSVPGAFALTNLPGPATTIAAVSGGQQLSITNAQYPSPLKVQVTDANGNPVANATVTFNTANGSLAGIVNTSAITDGSGIASALVTANATAGSFIVVASTPGPLSPATFSLTNKVPPAASITATGGTPQSAPISTSFTNPLKATVKDANGNPIGGLSVAFNAPASGASGTFTGSSVVVTDNTGVATAPAFKANATAGSYSVTAVVGALSTTFALTNAPPPPGTIFPSSGGGQTAPINNPFTDKFIAFVKDTTGVPVGGVTVTFTAPATGASGTFAGGGAVVTAVTASSGLATAPIFSANGTSGSYTVLATVQGVATPAQYPMTNCNCVPASISATGGGAQVVQKGTAFTTPLTALVKDANNVPIKGITVTFANPPSGAGVVFAGGINTAVTNASGVATSAAITANGNVGSYNITASVAGLASTALYHLTNTSGPVVGIITVTDVSVGKDLEDQITINLSTPAPVGGVLVTISSSDPNQAVIAARVGDVGVGTLTAKIKEGVSQLGGIYVQGLVSSGQVTITASADSWLAGTNTVTLTPSGFGLNANGLSTLTTNQSADPIDITVNSIRLDSSLNPAGIQPVRGGLSVPVDLTSVGVGSLSSTTVVIADGLSSATTQYSPAGSVGSATLTAVTPPTFSTPASGNTVAVSVTVQTIAAPNTKVGSNLASSIQISLDGVAPTGGLPITITSNAPGQFLLAKKATDPGSSSIIVTAPKDFSVSPPFYVVGVGNAGTATYTATAPGFGSAQGTVTSVPSAIIMSGPGAIGTPGFSTTPGAANSTVAVYSVMLDGHFTPQNVAGGVNVSVNVTSSDQNVGTIVASPLTIQPGAQQAFTQFHPVGPGSATLSVDVPAGFSAPGADDTVFATVTTPGISLGFGATLGQNLQEPLSISLGQAAPANGVTITVSVTGNVSLSATPTGTGMASVQLFIPSGQLSGTVYLYGGASSGSGSINASASAGYSPRSGTVTLVSSGVILAGPLGDIGSQVPDAVSFGNPATLKAYTAQLDSAGKYVGFQTLAGNVSVTVGLNTTGSGTTPSAVTIAGGSDHADVVFTPTGPGSASVSLGAPSGVTRASVNGTTVFLTVQ